MALVLGSNKNDKIKPGDVSGNVSGVPTDDADTIVGELGNDDIKAGGGDDLVLGDINATLSQQNKAGSDKIEGNTGDDTLVGDSQEFGEDAKGGKDTLKGGEDDDTLHGDAVALMTDAKGGDDKLDGGDGDDTLRGEATTLDGGKGGKDKLEGGDGDDVLYGDASEIDGAAKGGDDKLEGGDGNDELYGDAAEFLDDESTGGKDTLDGGNGDDILDGGRGDDKLEGGDGNDTFVIGLESGDDEIQDFEENDDLIDLSALFTESGLSLTDVFGDDERLDDNDEFVREKGGSLEIDLGQLFGTGAENVDTLVIKGVDNLSGDQVITS